MNEQNQRKTKLQNPQENQPLTQLENQDIIHQFSFGHQPKMDLYSDEAKEYLHKKIDEDPNDAESFEHLGIAYIADGKRTGDFKTGINYLFAALQKDPTNPIYIYNLGIGALVYKNFKTAEAMFQAALSLKPEYIKTLLGLCELYSETNQLDKLHSTIQMIKKQHPDNDSVLTYEINYLTDIRQFKQAEDLCLSLLRKYPYFINAHLTLASIYNKQGRIKEGTKSYIRALRVYPNNPYLETNLSLALLNQQKMRSGFHFYRSRRKVYGKSKISEQVKHIPHWTGQDLSNKKLFIYLEQGIGDMINFIPLLQTVLAKWNCTLHCFMYESLIPLFKQSITHPSLHWMTDLSETKNLSFDYQAPLLDLLPNLNFSFTTIAWPRAYLKPSTERISHWKEKLQAYKKPRIGINWQGNIMHKNDRNRSIPFETFMTIFNHNESLHLFNLHMPEPENRAALTDLLRGSPVIDMTPQLHNFNDSAAFIMNLDLVITVDTATAHLAGALGKRVIVLLALDNDWRWFESGDQTKWYPTMTLLRQEQYKDWASVLAEAKRESSRCL
ncbi:MAG: hypothetical protein KBE16_06275 [Alphaproteobacteria bacterium]|nr:hypothetical protein [Alphaproteobacteria bacterium]MBP9878154.1 hypothetical protein [Alphaproteobacteria bacterium]